MRDTVRGQVRDGVRDTIREPVHHCPGKERSDAHSSLKEFFSYAHKHFPNKTSCANVQMCPVKYLAIYSSKAIQERLLFCVFYFYGFACQKFTEAVFVKHAQKSIMCLCMYN